MCEDCGQVREVGRLLIGTEFFDDRKELRNLSVKIEDEVLEEVYRNLGSLEEKLTFLRVYKNFFCDNKCFDCENKKISFLDFRDVKGYCNLCRTSSSVYINSDIIIKKSSVLKKKLFSSLTIYALCLLKKTSEIYKESYKLYALMYLFTQFGKGLNGFVSRCLWCGKIYDYVHRIPLVYTCEFQEKHIFCTQCYYNGSIDCIFDKVIIKNIRLYYEIIDVIYCKNNCGYFGVNFFLCNSNEFICENCQKQSEIGKNFDIQIKKCLMYFKIFCKQHKRLVNFFNRYKFEGFCYYCRDYEAIEVDNKQLVGFIEQKINWIKEEIVKNIDEYQQNPLSNTFFHDFMSIKEKLKVINDFLAKMNKFYFFEPKIKPAINQNYILPEDQIKLPGYYSEEITLETDFSCSINGLLIKPRKELNSCLIKFYCEGQIVLHQVYSLEILSKETLLLEKPFKINEKTAYLIHIMFKIQENFPIHQYRKFQNLQTLIKNKLTLTYSISSQHRANILIQGLIITK